MNREIRTERGVGANIYKGLKKKRPENGEGVNRGIRAEREIRTERGVRVNRRIWADRGIRSERRI